MSGVWVGGEDRSIHFFRTQQGEGGRMALPIYGRYMEKIYQDKSLGYDYGHFPAPSGKISKNYSNCFSSDEPRRRRRVAVDTVAADALLDRMNDGGAAVPDSLK